MLKLYKVNKVNENFLFDSEKGKKMNLFFNTLKLLMPLLFVSGYVVADQNHVVSSLEKLQQAYPDHIAAISADHILWCDGTNMSLGVADESRSKQEILDNPSLADQLNQPRYKVGQLPEQPSDDPGRVRYEQFFKKMYGGSAQEVQENLVPIAWMPNVFGDNTYTLMVTTVNNVAQKMMQISDQLEILVQQHPDFVPFLQAPGGTFCWRNIANTKRLSCHSFGMTIDINVKLSQYWQWDLKEENRPVTEEEVLQYRNTIPWQIVEIFERHGFIWGGKWYHYDTMHFEYRPELIDV